MEETEVVKYLKEHIRPVVDSLSNNYYRVSVYLKDGEFLPCVVIKSLNQFKKRIENKNREEIIDYLERLLRNDNILSTSNILRIEQSKLALPIEIMQQIKGETLPSFTGFVIEMKDGKFFNFGTSFSTLFFDFPEGYTETDIKRVINHSYVDDNNEIQEYRKHRLMELVNIQIFHQKDNYFSCYVNGLE